MLKEMVEKEILYEGLGFPIVLKNVPMIELRGVWTLDVDLNILQKAASLALAHHLTDLTGNQVRYIRT